MPQTAVAYARYSHDTQREESITAQFRAIHEYAKKNGITIVQEYVDEAKSASVFATKPRLEFEQMLDDIMAERIKVKYVFFHKIDRFGRNDYDIARFKHFTRQKGIKIIYVDMDIPEGPEGVIVEQMMIGWAEYYSLNLSKEIRKGMKENALSGKHRGGRPPLGYDKTKDGKYIINQQEAPIVKKIFEMVAEGEGYSAIIDYLNEKGYKTKLGKPFGKNSIHDLLKNEKYVGVYTAGKYSTASTGGEIITLPGEVPAIIARELWDEVQSILLRRKQVAPRNKGKTIYLLTGKIFCGKCGGAYTGRSGMGGRGRRYRYSQYDCTNKRQTRTCDNAPIRKEIIENYVLDEIENLFKRTNMESIATQIEERYKKLSETSSLEIEILKESLADINKRMDRLFEAIETGTMDSQIAGPRLNSLASEKERKEARLNMLNKTNLIPFTKEQVVAWLKLNREILADRKDLKACKKMIERYIEKVILGEKNIKIQLKIQIPSSEYKKTGSHKENRVSSNVGGPGGYLTLDKTISRDDLKRWRKI